VSGSEDSTVRLFNAVTGQQFQERTEIHSPAVSLDRRPATPCNRAICFGSSLDHALQDPAELLKGNSHQDLNLTPVVLEDDVSQEDDTSQEDDAQQEDGVSLEIDGWMVGPHRQLLFWVPLASRRDPFYYHGTVLVIPSGLEIDMSRMTHGEHWSNCRNA
jgi:hypothetical protein